MPIEAPEPPEIHALAVAFFDLTDFMIWADAMAPLELFEVMEGYAALVDETVAAGGGQVLKHMGDDGLAVFPGDDVDGALAAMMKAQGTGAAWLQGQGIRTQMTIRLGFGDVAFGLFRGQADVLGRAVNETAALKKGRVSLTPAFHAALSPVLQGGFRALDGATRFERIFD